MTTLDDKQATAKRRTIAPRRPAWRRVEIAALAPFAALAVLMAVGAAINPDFLGAENLLNVVTRASFIAMIAVGATFVISAGGLDLSVGAMAAFVAGVTILFMNTLAPDAGALGLAEGIGVAIVLGGLCGFGNGLIVSLGRIEPFIVTLGTMGIFRALITYLANGGTIALRNSGLREIYRPFYFAMIAGVPIPMLAFAALALVAAVVLYKTPFGRHVMALGSNSEVARYSGLPIGRVRILTYVIQGLCVGLAVVFYIPRLGSATPNTGTLWELQAITAVVVGGTALRGGVGRVFGSVCGAVLLEMIGNIMILSNVVSEYLIGAVQGAIIIIAMLVQRGLIRNR